MADEILNPNPPAPVPAPLPPPANPFTGAAPSDPSPMFVGPKEDPPLHDPDTAAARLRAFEDEHLGKDAVRLAGDRVERGSGSLYQRMTPEQRKAHAALEKTAETEQKLADARAALAIAENEHNLALKAADDAVANIKPPAPAEPEKVG